MRRIKPKSYYFKKDCSNCNHLGCIYQEKEIKPCADWDLAMEDFENLLDDVICKNCKKFKNHCPIEYCIIWEGGLPFATLYEE